MFRTANKVTRPEKALILGFMAGSRGMREMKYESNEENYKRHRKGECFS